MNDPLPGRYRHYKGKEYTVLEVARHSETLEELVVYRPEYGQRELWVRPKAMFLETVTVDGREVPRFERIASEAAPSCELPTAKDLLADIPSELPQELAEVVLSRPGLRIERIASHGHASPDGFWYDQNRSEFVVLVQGAAKLEFESHTVEMKPGNFIDIPAHRRHRVAWTTPDEQTIWLAVHYRDEV